MSASELLANSPIPGSRTPLCVLSGSITTTPSPGTSEVWGVTVPAPMVLQSPGQFRIVIDSEILLVTAGADGVAWSMTRGVEGSTVAEHAAGAEVWHYLTAGGLAAFVDDASHLPSSMVSDSRSGGATEVDSTGITTGETLKYNGTKLVPGAAGIVEPVTLVDPLTVPDIVLSGLTGATASGRFAGLTSTGHPTSGTFLAGDFVLAISTGNWWVCTTGGTPGTWISPTAVPNALVAHVVAASTAGADVTTPAVDTTGATLLVAAIGRYASGGSEAISDSKGNTWTLATQQTAGADAAVHLYYCAATPTVGAGHTFTTVVTGGTAYPAVAVAAFSGTAGTAADIAENHSALSVSTIQPGNATPAHNNEIVVAATTSGTVIDTYAVDSGFAIIDQTPYTGGAHMGVALAWLKQGTAAALNPTWTGSGGSADRVALMGSWQ